MSQNESQKNAWMTLGFIVTYSLIAGVVVSAFLLYLFWLGGPQFFVRGPDMALMVATVVFITIFTVLKSIGLLFDFYNKLLDQKIKMRNHDVA